MGVSGERNKKKKGIKPKYYQSLMINCILFMLPICSFLPNKLRGVLITASESLGLALSSGFGQNATGQNVTGQNVTTKRHIDKLPHRQNATGQNATLTIRHRTKRHPDKMSQDKTPLRQNVTGQNVT